MRTLKIAAVALAAALGPWIAAPAQANLDITTLAGYEVVTSGTFNFGPNGWAGWSIKTGKVILGAKIISGDPISEFTAFRPVGPGETTPFGYEYGANEYGWIIQNALNGPNNGVQMELYYAFKPDGYTITKSSDLSYSATGVGGWSAPIPQVVSGGGYQFATTGASASLSQVVLENGNVAGYQYGPNEQGWTVQSAQVGGSANIYVVSFDNPAVVPVPAALPIIGAALAGFGFAGWRQRKSAA